MARGFWDIVHTIEHFLRSPQEIGAILPSSPFLARRMIKAIQLKSAQTVVELGAGTGAITSELINCAEAGTKIIIIDSNASAIAILRQRLAQRDNTILIHGDARQLKDLLRNFQITHVDAIISSLPYASMNEETINQILSQSAQLLTREGHFVAFQYSPIIKPLLKKHFFIHRSEVELINLPPAIVYQCTTLRYDAEKNIIKETA